MGDSLSVYILYFNTNTKKKLNFKNKIEILISQKIIYIEKDIILRIYEIKGSIFLSR